MRRGNKRRRYKKIGLAIVSMVMIFMLTAPTVLAVGVHVDKEANPVAEDGIAAPDAGAAQEGTVNEGSAAAPEEAVNPDGTESTDPAANPDAVVNPDGTENLDGTESVTNPEALEGETGEKAPEEPKIQPIQNLGGAADPIAGSSNPHTQKLEMMQAGASPLSTADIPVRSDATTGIFDISAGNLSITETGYDYAGTKGDTPANGYKIIGTTNVNSIFVQSGTANITLSDVQIDLNGKSNLPALTIESGATVKLDISNSVKPSSILNGGTSSAAINVKSGGKLYIYGTGVLALKGGSGAPAIGGNAGSPLGGYVSFEDAQTRVYAYSDSTGGAIHMLNVRATNAKLLRGTLAPGAVQAATQQIIMQNRNESTEAYALDIPGGYISFAVTTTPAGGEYIAYIAGKQNDHELLVSGAGTHVFNLLNSNEIADLKELSSQVVNYRVTYNANTGFFKQGASQVGTITVDVPFNSTITPITDVPEKVNNKLEKTDDVINWYTASDGTGKWNFANNILVRDTTLYVKWIPDKCIVNFKGGYQGAPTLTPSSLEINYNQLINIDDLPEVGDRTGYKRDGWVTEDKKKWDFDNDRVTKETMTLSANWRQQCTVIFNENAPAGEVSGMPTSSAKDYFIGETLGNVSEPSRRGYAFAGWYTTSNADLTKPAWDVSNTKLTGLNTNLYAGWAVDPCQVVFYTEADGSGTTQQVGYKDLITPLPDGAVTKPARPNPNPTEYKVEGWYTDAKLTQKWDFDKPLVSTAKEFNLYAKWRQVDCYVTFNGNGGTVEIGGNKETQTDKKISYDNKVDAPDFKLDGYELTSWTLNDEKGAKWSFETKIKEDMTLMANWTIKKYELSFDAKEGTPGNGPVMIEYDKPCSTTIVQPKRPGYAFSGWYSDENYAGDTKWDIPTTKMPAKNVTLYAKWEPLIYTVSFDTMGGQPTPLADQDSLEYTDAIVDPTAATPLTKEHYTFEGWYTNSEFRGSAWNFTDKTVGDAGIDLVEDEVNKTGTLTLYAKWKPEIYTVTFKADTAKPDEPEPDLPTAERKQDIEYNTPVVRPKYPETEWKGHTLLGWYSDPAFEESTRWSFSDEEEPILLDRHITLYAKWQCNEYRVGFVAEDEEPVWSDVTYHYGKTINEPEAPKKQNYEFEGWYTNPERTGDKWNFTKNKIETDETDIIFYAKYLGEPRTLNVFITYEEGNPKYDTPIKQTKQVRYGDKLELMDIENETNKHTKKRPGYTLNGWATEEAGTTLWNFDTDRIGGDSGAKETSLYGTWSRDKYTITFDTDGGEKVAEQICEYEWKIEKPNPDPKKTHYQFMGWFKEKIYENEWDFGADLVYGHTTLYAKWQPNVYKLLFETNGGSKLGAIDVEYGTTIPSAALTTTKEGYFVSGWYRDSEYTVPFDVKKDLVDSDKMTLYAKWELNNYTVKYQITDTETNEEAIEEDPNTYHVGDKLKKPDFAREHKTLSIWYQDPSFSEKWLFKRDTVKGDTTLYAYWSPTLYKVRFETYGGSETTELELEWGSQFEDPGEATKDGYTFTGWYADSTYTTLWDFEEDYVDGDTTLYAGWSVNSYTVTFDGDGGGPVPESMVLPFGSLVPPPADPAKEGMVFAGWMADNKAADTRAADGTAVWNFNTDTVPGDVTLTAQWTAEVVPGENPGDTTTQDPGNTGSDAKAADGNGTTTQAGTANAGNTTDTGTGTVTKALDQLKSAADNLTKILTGDDAPLLWAIVGVMLSAVGIGWVVIRKSRRK